MYYLMALLYKTDTISRTNLDSIHLVHLTIVIVSQVNKLNRKEEV
jgi:hypothetical protein